MRKGFQIDVEMCKNLVINGHLINDNITVYSSHISFMSKSHILQRLNCKLVDVG
jgi:hypothetical protein